MPYPNAGHDLRAVYHWAEYDDLPEHYRSITKPNSAQKQERARDESQHSYRLGVGGRNVVDTLFDALAFFQRLDSRLISSDSPAQRYAFGVCELPATEEPNSLAGSFLARPLGLDTHEVFLPDIACRWWERRKASWGPADKELKDLVARAKKERFGVARRQIRFRVFDPETRKIVAYGGDAEVSGGISYAWVERIAQVRRDVGAGYPYFVRHGDAEIKVTEGAPQSVLALNGPGQDALPQLPKATEWKYGWERLRHCEEYRDLYLAMRLHGDT